jgi:hypothetical protein
VARIAAFQIQTEAVRRAPSHHFLDTRVSPKTDHICTVSFTADHVQQFLHRCVLPFAKIVTEENPSRCDEVVFGLRPNLRLGSNSQRLVRQQQSCSSRRNDTKRLPAPSGEVYHRCLRSAKPLIVIQNAIIWIIWSSRRSGTARLQAPSGAVCGIPARKVVGCLPQYMRNERVKWRR